ncbi:MAG: C45 family autoproteolytic acyltransferase/hydrolase [Bacteroidota bacterium]
MRKDFFILILGILLTACSSKDNEPSGDLYEGGKLYRSHSGAFYIAELHGTFHQMGRQYGLLLKQQIGAFYQEAINDYLIGERGVKYDALLQSGRNYYKDFSQSFRDYLDGMAETNGLDADKTYILSEAIYILGFMGCSSLSAWGEYTPDGQTVTGRNLDLPFASLRKFSKYLHVVVWNPADYPASVASIDYIGGLFYQTALNSKGVFMELQNGENSDTAHPTGRENANNILLESLFRNTTANEVDKWFHTNLPDCGLIMNASFADHTTIYEWSTFRVAARNADGLISATNDFFDPSWHSYPIPFFDSVNEGIGYTWTRRKNLMRLGEQYRGDITPEKMMMIIDQTLPLDGATFPESGLIKTIYSVVVRPSELKIWFKVREYSGWEEIDLKSYFSN